MYEHFLTIGLFDKESEKQELTTETAKNIVADTLINGFEVYAFTMIDCFGVYKMVSSGRIVKEPSIRVEIATVLRIIQSLKTNLNQETIMYKMTESEIDFV